MIPTASQIRRQYIDFFVKEYGHKEIPSASLIPENDPTVLFTTAGMHPLVPYLMGEPHPSGRRLVNAQKSLRTDDIDEVGDATHLTFFEMLGNWSLGDYFKEEAIKMSFELLTLPWGAGGYSLPIERLSISCFAGDADAPRDTESAEIWMAQKTPEGKSIHAQRIYFFPKKKNWWGPAGQTGPCGPDTEMFYDTLFGHPLSVHKKMPPPPDLFPPDGHPSFKKGDCHPACDCGRFVEVWNDVFMQYNKKADPSTSSGQAYYEPLKQKNVDTGLGFERLVAILQEKESPFETELFAPVITKIRTAMPSIIGSETGYFRSYRIIADHVRAATFILGDACGITPSNLDQGYILRRLIRRAIRRCRFLGMNFIGKKNFISELANIFIEIYKGEYSELEKNREKIIEELNREEERFAKTLDRGLREIKPYIDNKEKISGEKAFYFFETYGFPEEMIREEMRSGAIELSLDEEKQFLSDFNSRFKKHQDLSRAGATQKFSGGLADHSEQSKMHHTATHLVHQALRDVLGSHVFQRGSNITKERLRFDFSHTTKMTPEQVKKVEETVNAQIMRDLPVHFEILEVNEAKRRGAIGLFEDKYAQLGNKVKVYFMGDYSLEVCGGPHVEHTGVLKHFKILKEEACSAGVRRIKAVVSGIKDVPS